ncbi:MAG TPA: threonine/serine dehydratase [Gemmatimonadales bacterium]|nr:threonine/serine dehydratase [Gemmatimonadales bacterium]
MSGAVSADSIREAAGALAGVAERTPLLPLPDLGGSAWLKAENRQPIGAFKIRGAFTAVRRLSDADRARGVITHSSGNHGQAVAFAAKHFGIPAVIVMPADAPRVKQEGVRRYGGEIAIVEHRSERVARCEAIAAERGLVSIPPYEHADVIAGQATCGLEILEDLAGVTTIVVPVGGGGLIAGIASAVRHFSPSVRVVAVEPTGAPKLARALEAGKPVRLEDPQSIADGLLPPAIGTLPFEVLRGIVTEAVQVSDEEIAAAVRYLHHAAGERIEPSGAAATAALLAGRIRSPGTVVAIASGGNVDPEIFERLVH